MHILIIQLGCPDGSTRVDVPHACAFMCLYLVVHVVCMLSHVCCHMYASVFLLFILWCWFVTCHLRACCLRPRCRPWRRLRVPGGGCAVCAGLAFLQAGCCTITLQSTGSRKEGEGGEGRKGGRKGGRKEGTEEGEKMRTRGKEWKTEVKPWTVHDGGACNDRKQGACNDGKQNTGQTMPIQNTGQTMYKPCTVHRTRERRAAQQRERGQHCERCAEGGGPDTHTYKILAANIDNALGNVWLVQTQGS